jgi:hypothetical protein
MKRLLKPSRWLAMFAVSFLVLAFPAVSPAQAKQVSSSVGTSVSLRSLRNQGEQQCIQPPQHLNLQTLSDAQLSLYGLPPRNIWESAPAFWSFQVAHYQHRTCGPAPAALDYRLRPAVTGYPQNWAGNWAYGNRGTYRQAWVTFTVPRVSGQVDLSSAGFWAGVGGQSLVVGGTYGLVQAGVVIQVKQSSSGGVWLYNEAFWEFVSNGPGSNTAQPIALAIYPGDSIEVFVSSNFQNDGYDYIQLCNNTRGTCSNPVYVYGDFSDSASGECIGEEPGLSPANFGTEELSGCYIENNSGTLQGVGDWPHNYSYISNSSGTSTLVAVGSIDSSGADFPLFYCSTRGRGDFCG